MSLIRFVFPNQISNSSEWVPFLPIKWVEVEIIIDIKIKILTIIGSGNVQLLICSFLRNGHFRDTLKVYVLLQLFHNMIIPFHKKY